MMSRVFMSDINDINEWYINNNKVIYDVNDKLINLIKTIHYLFINHIYKIYNGINKLIFKSQDYSMLQANLKYIKYRVDA